MGHGRADDEAKEEDEKELEGHEVEGDAIINHANPVGLDVVFASPASGASKKKAAAVGLRHTTHHTAGTSPPKIKPSRVISRVHRLSTTKFNVVSRRLFPTKSNLKHIFCMLKINLYVHL
jgi:hypothetical protein